MSILDIFNRQQPQQPQQPASAVGQPGNIPQPTVAGQPTTANETSGAVPVVPPATNAPKSPLDEYATLWETKPDGGTPDGQPAPNTQVTPEAVREAVSKVKFTDSITPETLAAITAGGEGAAAAFMQAMQSVAQQVMVQSTLVSNKLTQNAVNQAVDMHSKNLPNVIRDQSASATIQQNYPLLSNPAIKPVADAAKTQILQAYPNATPVEVATMVHNYLQAMGQQFAPAPVTSETKQDVDWSKFLNP